MNIIGDIAGNYKTLLALVEKMPKEPLLAVGDLIDRGPRSKEVLEWFIKNDEKALLGNHEQMMLDSITAPTPFGTFSWLRTGGDATLKSFSLETESIQHIPSQFPKWLQSLPLFFENNELFISHAPVSDIKDIPYDKGKSDYQEKMKNFIWNRSAPTRLSKYHIFGHNSHFGLRYFSDAEGEYALFIDTSWERSLTGINWPTRQIFQQEYID